ncbi:MAG: nucleotidyltransferase family protein [Solirubrobacterales bacterium]
MIDAIILAGGLSRRMGRPKPLLRFSEDRTFLDQIVAILRSSQVDRITAVLGAHAELVQQSIDSSGARVVVNRECEKGQLSSLIVGLTSLPADSEAIVLCLVDNPLVTVETVDRLVAAFRKTGNPIVIPIHEGKRGHPTVFGASLFQELIEAPASEGAKYVVRSHADQVLELDVSDVAVTIGIDTPQQYREHFGCDPCGCEAP